MSEYSASLDIKKAMAYDLIQTVFNTSQAQYTADEVKQMIRAYIKSQE